ncbi:MAG: hypothetical protein JWQ11_4141 [Rhizobacter sp.]|nr:hypothetical protein [Rhizobacter sp.]
MAMNRAAITSWLQGSPGRVKRMQPGLLSQWPGWRHLPRDPRDTLFLLAVIGWTVMPHLLHLPWWCGALTAVVLSWRARLAVIGAALPGRWVLAGVLGLAIALTFFSYRTVLGKEPGVALLVAMMALKTLELRARRDAFVVFFLGFFLILTQFLYSQSLLSAAAMLVSIWGLLTALVLAHMPVGKPRLMQAGALSLRTALLGAPVMALLFLLFPRVGPLWGVPQDGVSRTGLSNSMSMGTIAELATDDSVALRLRFTGAVPPPEAMYFRGPVLSHFDGREWTALPVPVEARLLATPAGGPAVPAVITTGNPIRYEMTVEPQRITALTLLESTPDAPQIEGYRPLRLPSQQWRVERPIADRIRFDAVAYLSFSQGPTENLRLAGDYLDLPRGYNPRTVAWAADLHARMVDADPRRLAQAVTQHIRSAGFSYVLSPGVYGDDDPFAAIDEFWLDRKLGFCEHYAAAFVVVMRAMGVPARVVTGYQGSDPEPVDGYYVVRNSSAHAWAEYWQQGSGWIRADPTAAVAPDRIIRSRNLQPPRSFVADAIGGVNPELLALWRSRWELTNNRWNQWVLNYSRGAQFDLLKRIGFESPGWEDLTLMLICTLSGLSLAGAGWAWWDRRRQDPWIRLMNSVRKLLAAAGFEAPPHVPPRTLARLLRERFAEAASTSSKLLEQLDRERYGSTGSAKPDRDLSRRLLHSVAMLKPRRR